MNEHTKADAVFSGAAMLLKDRVPVLRACGLAVGQSHASKPPRHNDDRFKASGRRLHGLRPGERSPPGRARATGMPQGWKQDSRGLRPRC
jgi:hypothetical protein